MTPATTTNHRSSRPSGAGRIARSALSAAGLLSVVGIAVFAGCAAPYDRHGVDSTQFQDVVVPSGFRLEDRAHESFSREEASWRQGHFVYTGTTKVDVAVAYVLQGMPRHQWQVVAQETTEDEAVHLRFERGIYAADYVFRRNEGTTQMVVDYATDFSRR